MSKFQVVTRVPWLWVLGKANTTTYPRRRWRQRCWFYSTVHPPPWACRRSTTPHRTSPCTPATVRTRFCFRWRSRGSEGEGTFLKFHRTNISRICDRFWLTKLLLCRKCMCNGMDVSVISIKYRGGECNLFLIVW